MGEAEPRLGWESFSGLQGGGKVGRGFKGEKVSVVIGVSRWGEGVLAMVEHGTRVVVGSEAARLGAEEEKDSIRFPVTEGMDGSLVNTGNEKGSSATGLEAVGFDTVWRDVSDVVDGGSSTAQFVGVFMSSDVMWMLGGVIVVKEGAVR